MEIDPTRKTFVQLLFSLTAAEIARQVGVLVAEGQTLLNNPAPYAHLTLALMVVATSWVGWTQSQAPGNREPIKSVFSWPFIVLLFDVLIVIFYFILVRGAEVPPQPSSPSVPVRPLPPSAANETVWMSVIFGAYFLWDLLTEQIIPCFDGDRKLAPQRLLSTGISLICFLCALLFHFLEHAQGQGQVVSVDGGLLALVLLFRFLKQAA